MEMKLIEMKWKLKKYVEIVENGNVQTKNGKVEKIMELIIFFG